MLTFAELLDYTEEETARWLEWLRGRDLTALEVNVGSGERPTVRELIAHVFIVEHRYADRLHGDEPASYESFPARTLDDLADIHRRARARLRSWVEVASPEQWEERLAFNTITAGPMGGSKRKIVAHALMHGIRHWAQIATALRQAGHPQPWLHDLLASDAME